MEPFGEEVIQRLKAEKGVICILGNHERWALERRRRRKDVRRFFEPCNISDVCRRRRRAVARVPGLAVHPARPLGSGAGGRPRGDVARPAGLATWRESRRRGPARSCGTACWSRPTPNPDRRPHAHRIRAGGQRPCRQDSESGRVLLEDLRLQVIGLAHRARRVPPGHLRRPGAALDAVQGLPCPRRRARVRNLAGPALLPSAQTARRLSGRAAGDQLPAAAAGPASSPTRAPLQVSGGTLTHRPDGTITT